MVSKKHFEVEWIHDTYPPEMHTITAARCKLTAFFGMPKGSWEQFGRFYRTVQATR